MPPKATIPVASYMSDTGPETLNLFFPKPLPQFWKYILEPFRKQTNKQKAVKKKKETKMWKCYITC